jgi:hypothetical protein
VDLKARPLIDGSDEGETVGKSDAGRHARTVDMVLTCKDMADDGRIAVVSNTLLKWSNDHNEYQESEEWWGRMRKEIPSANWSILTQKAVVPRRYL